MIISSFHLATFRLTPVNEPPSSTFAAPLPIELNGCGVANYYSLHPATSTPDISALSIELRPGPGPGCWDKIC